jgi:hypothetical protein
MHGWMLSYTYIQEENYENIAAYLLKARIVDPERQQLLANGSETAFVSRQRTRNNEIKSVATQQILDKR